MMLERNVVVRVLSIAGCPHVEQTVERVWAAVRAEELKVTRVLDAGRVTVERVTVTGEAMARELRFLGSPSVHVNGRDVEPDARESEAIGLGCRTYVEAGVEADAGVGAGADVGAGVHARARTGMPSVALLRRALREGLGDTGVDDARRAAHGDAAEAAVESGAEG